MRGTVSVGSVMTYNQITDFLSSFHYSEPFDENKEYTSGTFQKDYGKGKFHYCFMKYTFTHSEVITSKDLRKNPSMWDTLPQKSFVVVEEILSKKEMDELLPYCQCKFHRMSFLNPMKYFTCPCCVGCIGSSDLNSNQYVIDKTREKYNREKEKRQFSSF